MDERPEQPSRKAAQPHPAEICDGSRATDYRQRPEVSVAERPRLRLSRHFARYDLGYVFAMLSGDRGKAGQRFTVASCEIGYVADREDLVVTRDRAIRLYPHGSVGAAATPSQAAAGRALTPAHQKTLALSIRSPETNTPEGSMPSTAAPSRTVTPRSPSARAV